MIVDHYATTEVPRERWLMDPDMAFDNVGPEPVWDDAVLLSVEDRKAAKLEEEEEGILEAMREYAGPMTKPRARLEEDEKASPLRSAARTPRGRSWDCGARPSGSCGTDAMTIKGMLRETYFYSGGTPDARVVASLDALCPGCGFEHSFAVGSSEHDQGRPVWEFDGNYETPTFNPSMLSNRNRDDEHKPICHSWLHDGIWQFLGDCTHEMAGQHVPMIPPEPDATFQRRHGWHLYPWTDDEGNPKPKAQDGN